MILLKAFRQAVSGGHGRAFRLLPRPADPDHVAIIVEACLVESRFDRQCEYPHSPYLAELLAIAGASEDAIAAIEQRVFAKRASERNRVHQCDVLRELASRGSERARSLLYLGAESRFPTAEYAVAELDGIPGLLWLLSRPGYTLPKEDLPGWYWGSKVFDDKDPSPGLARIAEELPLLKPLAALYQEGRDRAQSSPKPPDPTYAQFQEGMAKGEKFADLRLTAFRLRRLATQENLLSAAEAFARDVDEDRSRLLAHLLHRTSFDGKVDAILARPIDSDDAARIAAYALDGSTDPRLRAFGLSLLARTPPVVDGLVFLATDPKKGDELIALNALRKAKRLSRDDFHSVLISIREFAEQVPQLPWRQCLEEYYECAPCSICRGGAFDLLKDRGEATESLIADHEWDSEQLANPRKLGDHG